MFRLGGKIVVWKAVVMTAVIFVIGMMMAVSFSPYLSGTPESIDVNRDLPYEVNLESSRNFVFENVTEYTIVVVEVESGNGTIEHNKVSAGDIYVYPMNASGNLLSTLSGMKLKIYRIAPGDTIYVDNWAKGCVRVYGYLYRSFL